MLESLTAALSAVLIASGVPQETAPPEQDPPPLQDGPKHEVVPAPEPSREGFEASLILIPRVSNLSGDVNIDSDLTYSKLWGPGFGFGVEADFLGSLGKGWKMGGYVSLGIDSFPGNRVTDAFAVTWDPDALTFSHFLAGFKVQLVPDGGFYFDGRAGFGPVFYPDIDAVSTTGGVSSTSRVFDATTDFAVEVAVHVGYSSKHVFVAGGFAGRIQGSPDPGDFIISDIDDPYVGSLEIEVGFRF